MDRFSTLPANCTICAVVLLGTIFTGLIRSDLKRQAAGKEKLKEEEKHLEIEV